MQPAPQLAKAVAFLPFSRFMELQRQVAEFPDSEEYRQEVFAFLKREAGESDLEKSAMTARADLYENQELLFGLFKIDPFGRAASNVRDIIAARVQEFRSTRYWHPSPEQRPILDWKYRMGFVESVVLSPSTWREDLAHLVPFNPIRHVALEQADVGSLVDADFPHIVALDLRRCGLGDAWLDRLAASSWAGRLKWLALNRNGDISDRGVKALAEHFPNLLYCELNGIGGANPIVNDDGFIPPAGLALEDALGREIPWIRGTYWLEGTIPPSAFELLDELASQAVQAAT